MRFENVRFRYSGDGPDVLDGVDLHVRHAETVALVGRSGAGKTTCANLLLRFWDAASGRILIGGHDVRDLPPRALRAAVTLVPQEVYLFNLPVRENIRLARPSATGAEVEAAARAANRRRRAGTRLRQADAQHRGRAAPLVRTAMADPPAMGRITAQNAALPPHARRPGGSAARR